MARLQGYLGAFYIYSDVNSSDAESVGAGDGSETEFKTTNDNVSTSDFHVHLSDEGSDVIRYWPRDFSLTPGGRISMVVAPSDAANVIADYLYSTGLFPAGGFTSWTADVTAETLDATSFNNTGWKKFVGGLNSWTGSAERHWLEGSDVFGYLGKQVVVRMYQYEDESDYYTGWAILSGISVNTPVDALIDQSLTFTGVDRLARSD